MTPKRGDDWSDSDEEDNLSEIETSVLLGIPDGPVDSATDLRDAAVSRIGGHPAFLTSPEPSVSSSQCKNCSNPMELLVQLWCPFEDTPMDRALYVWGCARGECQRKDGSVRAWRGLRYNVEYAKKLEKKMDRKRKQAATQKEKDVVKANPFKMSGSTGTSGGFGLGAQVFGGDDAWTNTTSSSRDEEESDKSSDTPEDNGDASSDEESLITAMASTTLDQSPWPSMPSYIASYLSTVSEYLPPPPKAKLPPGAQILDPDKEGKAGWTLEGYENSLEVDHVFERFTTRVGYEGKQCVRYDLGGTPLPFGNDKIFERLFPAPAGPPLPITKPDFMVQQPQKRTYSPMSLTKCPSCGGERVFECQLMPNLINVLKSSSPNDSDPQLTEEERKKEVEKVLKGGDPTKRGMEWGTCMVFSCKADCSLGGEEGEAKQNWVEEMVLVQWDD